MIGTIKEFFHISNHYMNHGQPFRRLLRWCYLGQVLLGFPNRIHGMKSVSTNSLPSLKVAIKKVSYVLSGNMRYDLHRHIASLGASFFNGHQYRLFSASTSPSFPRTFASHISVVEFYEVLQTIYAVTVRHRCSNFFKYIPRCRPRNSKLFGKSQSRDSAFVRSDKLYSPKPLNQRQICRMEQGPGSHGNLGFAFCALIYFARFGEPCGIMAAFRAHKTIGPTVSGNSCSTGFFRAVFLLPFKQTDLGHFHSEILL